MRAFSNIPKNIDNMKFCSYRSHLLISVNIVPMDVGLINK